MALVVLLVFTGCRAQIRDIPPGHVGKILTPKGWQEGFKSPGQVDILPTDVNRMGNKLILMDASSITVKESFTKRSDDDDHRMLTKDQVPLNVDVYVQLAAPSSEKEPSQLDFVFAMVPPAEVQGQDRVYRVNIEEIYNRFAQQHVRGKLRSIFSVYSNYAAVVDNYSVISTQAEEVVASTLKQNNVPLRLLAATLSNVKPDKKMWDARVMEEAADAQISMEKKRMDGIGKALRENPEYREFMQWEKLEQIVSKGNQSGNIFILNLNGANSAAGNEMAASFAAAEYLRQEMKPEKK
jgi:regulator of protease activity HflC (stomatin/prohibitin superfamily)